MKKETLSRRAQLKEEVEDLLKNWRPVMGNEKDIKIRDLSYGPIGIDSLVERRDLLIERIKEGARRLST